MLVWGYTKVIKTDRASETTWLKPYIRIIKHLRSLHTHT